MESNGSRNGLFTTRYGRIPQKVIYALLFTLVVVVIVLLLPAKDFESKKYNSGLNTRQGTQLVEYYTYNSTYPLSAPISE